METYPVNSNELKNKIYTGQVDANDIDELKNIDIMDEHPAIPMDDHGQKELIWNRVSNLTGVTEKAVEKTSLGKSWGGLLKIAASIIVMLSIGTVAYHYLAKPEKVEYLTLSTQKGSMKQLTLPDGSKVWLNAASTLRYPKNYGKNRELYLDEGEAYFEVAKNPNSTFIVHFGAYQTTVLGTSFNVKAYKALESSKVTVLTGKVRVSDTLATQHRISEELTPNKQITVLASTGTAKVETLAADQLTGIRQGEMVLNNVSFAELALAIENTFEVRLEFDEEAMRLCNYSISFNKNDKLTDVLEALKTIHRLKFNYNQTTKIVKMYGKKCN